jgi:hypothetical protein
MGVKGLGCAKNMIWKELLPVRQKGTRLGASKGRALRAAGPEKNTKQHSIISGNCQ